MQNNSFEQKVVEQLKTQREELINDLVTLSQSGQLTRALNEKYVEQLNKVENLILNLTRPSNIVKFVKPSKKSN